MISRGVPMILSGDEFGNSQNGNNNAYCQDNSISWLDWRLLKENEEIFNYFKKIIKFRINHPILRKNSLSDNIMENGYPEISWHGVEAWNADKSYFSKSMGMLIVGGNNLTCREDNDDFIYFITNMHWEPLMFELPKLKKDFYWYQFANTALKYPYDIADEGKEKLLKNQMKICVKERSIIILIGKKSLK
jgi:glycogen operon protein